MLAATSDEDRWDDHIKIQLTINTTVSKTTGKTPRELFYYYKPRNGEDLPLLDLITQIPQILEDLPTLRQDVAEKIAREQVKQKYYFDKKRKQPKRYK